MNAIRNERVAFAIIAYLRAAGRAARSTNAIRAHLGGDVKSEAVYCALRDLHYAGHVRRRRVGHTYRWSLLVRRTPGSQERATARPAVAGSPAAPAATVMTRRPPRGAVRRASEREASQT